MEISHGESHRAISTPLQVSVPLSIYLHAVDAIKFSSIAFPSISSNGSKKPFTFKMTIGLRYSPNLSEAQFPAVLPTYRSHRAMQQYRHSDLPSSVSVHAWILLQSASCQSVWCQFCSTINGDHSRHFTAILQHRICNGTHQADTACPVNQTNVMFGKQAAQLFGCFKIYRIYLGAGSAIYAYGMYRFIATILLYHLQITKKNKV